MSAETQLVAGDTNGLHDVFVYDRQQDTTARLSVSSSGVEADLAPTTNVAISGDGRSAVFSTFATTLLGGDGDDAPLFFGTTMASRVTMPSSALSTSTVQSIDGWFKSASTTAHGVIVGMQNAAYPTAPTSYTPVLYVGSDGKLRGQFWNGAANPITSTVVVNDTRWHHVALTSTGSSQSLYLDGSLVGSRSGTVNHVGMTQAQVGIGFGTSWPALPTGWTGFQGNIDEVALYRQSLTSTRVNFHKASRTSGYKAAVLSDVPWSYWRLSEPWGPTAADASGAGRSATYAGSIYYERQGALTVDDNEAYDVFVRDRDTDRDGVFDEPGAVATRRINLSTSGGQSGGTGYFVSVSNDGRFVAYDSAATDLVPGDTNGQQDVFVRDRDTDADGIFDEVGASSTTRVSLSSSGAQATAYSVDGVISGDGRYVAFESAAALVPTDTNGKVDVYVRDRAAGTTELISRTVTGGLSNAHSGGTEDILTPEPDISDDGRYVVFQSAASNLAGGDADTSVSYYNGWTTLPTATLSGATALSVDAWIKTEPGTDGAVISMQDVAYPGTPTMSQNVVWVGTDGKLRGQFRTGVDSPITSTGTVNDNRWHHVALTSTASSQTLYLDGAVVGTLAGTVNHSTMPYSYIGRGHGISGFLGVIDEVAVYRSALPGTRVTAHVQARDSSYRTTVLADGPWAYWRLGEPHGASTAADASGFGRSGTYVGIALDQGRPGALTTDLNTKPDIFVRDRQAQTTTRVSRTVAEAELPAGGWGPGISQDGRVVTFWSDIAVIPSDTNGTWDMYLVDPTGANPTRVSIGSSGAEGNGHAWPPLPGSSTSADARYVTFGSYASNLVEGDTNNYDLFVRDRGLAATPTLSAEAQRFLDLWLPRLADDGFIADLLATLGYPAGIVAEGFHALDEDTKRLLALHLLQADLDERFPELNVNQSDLGELGEALCRIIFEKEALEPITPQNVVAVRGDTRATVMWEAPLIALDGLTTYTVTAYRAADNVAVASATTTAPVTTAEVTGLRNGTPVYFRVSAGYLVVTGPESAPSNAVTPAGPPFAPETVIATRADSQATVAWAPPSERPDGTPGHNGEPITAYTVTASPDGATVTVDGTAHAAVVPGLRNGTTYTFTVTATNVVGTGPSSAPSNPVTPAGRPFPPESVGATAGNGRATITWSAPSPRPDGTPGDNGDPILGYTVSAHPDSGPVLSADAPGSPFTFTGLTNGVGYTFTVAATNTVGTSDPSAPSARVVPAGPPDPVQSLVLYAGDGRIVADWEAGQTHGAPITGYTVSVSPADAGPITVPADTTVVAIDGLNNGTNYEVRIRTKSAAGSSAVASGVATPAPPPTPAGFHFYTDWEYRAANQTGGVGVLYDIPGTDVGFEVVSGPNAGAFGICSSFQPGNGCITDSFGFLHWTYFAGPGLGTDTVQAYLDQNDNGVRDVGEPATTTQITFHEPAAYIALGDSYSAGEGLDPFYPGTDVEGVNECHRSEQAYPVLATWNAYNGPLSGEAEIPGRGVSWAFAACSGARIRNVLPAAQGGVTQWDDEPPQLDDSRVGSDTDLVTITIGGNDMLFADVLSFCYLESNDCMNEVFDHPENTSNLILSAFLESRANDLHDDLVALYDAVLSRTSDDTAVFVLGYPHLLPDQLAEQNCSALFGFQHQEQNRIRYWTNYFNDIIASAATEAGVWFVDVRSAFAGHEPCSNTNDDWIYGPLNIQANRRFHLTPAGQIAYATTLRNFINARIQESTPLTSSGLPRNPAS